MDSTRIRYIKEWIAQLPQGNITYKTIHGKRYPYYQWTENGKQHSRIVKTGELEELSEKIERRRALREQLKEAESAGGAQAGEAAFFFSFVKRGSALQEFVRPVKRLKKRECYSILHEYLYGEETGKVFILYGLKATGKTTLMRQAISEMDEKMLRQTAFIQVSRGLEPAQMHLDLEQLMGLGYRYVFIDEVTLMTDFVRHASFFSDLFAAGGMKIVLTGADSLGFALAQERELYGRSLMARTTFMPYREFRTLFGAQDIERYLCETAFQTVENFGGYIDAAVVKNMLHMLKDAVAIQPEYFPDVVNRTIEECNRGFAVSALCEIVGEKIAARLPVKEKTIHATAQTRIMEYLKKMDLTAELETRYLNDTQKKLHDTVMVQPSLRYVQAKDCVRELLEGEAFESYTLRERTEIFERTEEVMRERLIREIILLETQMAYPRCEVFRLVSETGQFDMVVFDPQTAGCSLYEIHRGAQMTKELCRNLRDEGNCKKVEFRYGAIAGKHVIYQGEAGKIGGIRYMNAEDYLRRLPVLS